MIWQQITNVNNNWPKISGCKTYYLQTQINLDSNNKAHQTDQLAVIYYLLITNIIIIVLHYYTIAV